MTWMSKWTGGFPLDAWTATLPRVAISTTSTGTDTWTSHSGTPEPWPAIHRERRVDAVVHRARTLGGLTTMLPTADAEWVAAELSRRSASP